MRFKLERIIVAGMILIPLVTFAYMTGTRIYPAILAVVVVVGALREPRIEIRGARELIVSLALALPFVSLWRMFPDYGPDISGLVDAQLSFAMGQYLLLLQASSLYIRREGSEPPRLVLFGVLTLICAGNVYLHAGAHRIYRVLCAIFGMLAVFFLWMRAPSARQKSRLAVMKYVLTATVLVLSLGVATSAGYVLQSYEAQLNQMFFSLMRDDVEGGSSGFSQEARLGSVIRQKRGGSRQVALRIFSREAPGYMRGQAYARYHNSEWKTEARKRELSPSERYSSAGPKNVFVAREPGAKPWIAFKVWPVPGIREGMFTPLCAGAVEAPTESMKVDENGVFSSETLVRGVPYTAYCGVKRAMYPPDADRYLALPALDRRIHRLAERIFSGRRTAPEKIAAVTTYFHTNYSYSLDIRIPQGRDPMTYFLVDKPSAHCEYFASATALLLRMGGVPTRYVAGYMVMEKNSVGGYWVARQKDAHAWVEAYVPEQGWVTVESTPTSGVPQPTGSAAIWDFWDYVRYRMQELMVALQLRGLRGLGRWLVARGRGLVRIMLASTWYGSLVKGVLVVLLTLYLLSRWRRGADQNSEARGRIGELQRLLARMDQRLEERGLVRSETETLHQFAQRIRVRVDHMNTARRLSAWYIHYAQVRYGRKVTQERVEELERSMSGA